MRGPAVNFFDIRRTSGHVDAFRGRKMKKNSVTGFTSTMCWYFDEKKKFRTLRRIAKTF